jgi:CheY-like chemotaxis protein
MGMTSMRERAVELGGACEVALVPAGGTRAGPFASACTGGIVLRPGESSVVVDSTRILIADDYTLFRYGLRAMLSSIPKFEVVGEATTGAEAAARAAELQPDVVLMDIQMPEVNGIEATRRIVEDSPNVGVIVLTMFEDDDRVFAAMRAGARGYVLKGAEGDEVLKVISAVTSGEAPTLDRRSPNGLWGFSPPPGRLLL